MLSKLKQRKTNRRQLRMKERKQIRKVSRKNITKKRAVFNSKKTAIQWRTRENLQNLAKITVDAGILQRQSLVQNPTAKMNTSQMVMKKTIMVTKARAKISTVTSLSTRQARILTKTKPTTIMLRIPSFKVSVQITPAQVQ